MQTLQVARLGLPLVALVAEMALAQGPLLPPGAPGETMKSLDQVEPRRPIQSAPFTITQAGSYYLTTNLTAASGTAISIQADNVTLDLMGFTITSYLEGIDFPSSCRNVVVRNGTIQSSSTGVDGRTLEDSNSLFEGLRVYDTSIGIYAGSGCTVRDCEVWKAELYGIHVGANGAKSAVLGCRVYDNNGVGLSLDGSGTRVAGNLVRGNGTNYRFREGNQLELLLSEVPVVLAWPCKATFAGTLVCSLKNTNGIDVISDHVTIDLAGHALVGPGALSGHGIAQDSRTRNLQVRNGKIAQWLGEGEDEISGLYGRGEGTQAERVQVASCRFGLQTGNGGRLRDCTATSVVEDGLKVGNGAVVEACVATDNGYGILAGDGSAVADCAANGNTGYGITVGTGASLLNSSASGNGQYGILLRPHATALNCSAWGNGDGFALQAGATARGCVAAENHHDGFDLGYYDNSRLMDCTATDNGATTQDGAGVRVEGSGNRIEGVRANGNDLGFAVTTVGGGNFLARNAARGNGVNWSIATGNVCFVVQALATGAPINGNAGGIAPGSSDPSVNFTY